MFVCTYDVTYKNSKKRLALTPSQNSTPSSNHSIKLNPILVGNFPNCVTKFTQHPCTRLTFLGDDVNQDLIVNQAE